HHRGADLRWPGELHGVDRPVHHQTRLHRRPVRICLGRGHAAARGLRRHRPVRDRPAAPPGGGPVTATTVRRRSTAPSIAPAPKPNRRLWVSKGHAIAAGLLTLAFVSPIYFTIVNAFKTQDQIIRDPSAPPAPPTTQNLTDALGRADRIIQVGLANSAVTVLASVLLIIPLGAALSFWLTRRSARFRRIVLAGFAAGLMIPPAVVLLPTIRILTFLQLDHTYPGLILANVGGGYLSFAVFVYSG